MAENGEGWEMTLFQFQTMLEIDDNCQQQLLKAI